MLGAVFMAMTLFIFILYGVLADKARCFFMDSPTAMRWLQKTFAATFAVLGVKLAMTEAG